MALVHKLFDTPSYVRLFSTRSDTDQAVKVEALISDLEYSENDGADQQHGYRCEAGLHLCFCICKNMFYYVAAQL